jgi:hypothetical protein
VAAGRWMRVAAVTVVAVAVLVGAGAGACGPKSAQPEDQGTTARPTRTEARPSSERHSDLEVADGVRPRAIDFVDSFTGYALFAGCGKTCGGALFVTFDGGSSWVERPLPSDRFDSVDRLVMHVVDDKTVVLTVASDGWYRSTNTGRTFVRGTGPEPGPADLFRGVGVGCATGGDCPPSVLVDGVATPGQPAFPVGLRSAARGVTAGPIWAVAADLTTAYTAHSADEGRTWQAVGGPLAVPGTNVLQVTVSMDGTDVWLLASNGPGATTAYYMHPSGWREVNAGVRVSPGITGGAAAGAGVLAVPGERFGFVFSDGQWSEAARPRTAGSVRMLLDETLLVIVGAGDVWLGKGSGAARLWNRVTLDPV